MKPRIVVGIGGGIAAFKSVYLVRELQRRGAEVRVVMTRAATRFVGPITFTGLTGQPPVVDLWDASYRGEVHVELGEWADAGVVAPATMNLLGRAAAGMANDAVLATLACMKGPVLFAPAMHTRMWNQASTQRSVRLLQDGGAHFVGPDEGELASGETGAGRMSEPDAIADAVMKLVGQRDFEGRSLLVSAGPTYEDLDPVRFLGNRSSGKMGFAIAAAAARRGATVTLVSGPSAQPTPTGVQRVDVRSARDMHAAITSRSADVVIMAAAVADYRPKAIADQKIKKSAGPMSLELERNPDILAELGAARKGARPILVGFALETEDVVAHARDKLTRKGADLIVANHASTAFGGDRNEVTLVDARSASTLEPASKLAIADAILDRVAELLEA